MSSARTARESAQGRWINCNKRVSTVVRPVREQIDLPHPRFNDEPQVRRWGLSVVQRISILLRDMALRLNGSIHKDGTVEMDAPLGLKVYTLSSLPAAADWQDHIVLVDGNLYRSTGSVWVQVQQAQLTDTTAVGNVGAGEDDLITLTLDADTVNEDHDKVLIKAFGTTAANGNNKTIKLYLGSTELTSAAATTPNDQDWILWATVIRTSATSAKAIVEYVSNDSGDNTVDYKAITEDFTTDLVVKCTGEGSSDDDIVQEALVVEVTR